MIDMLIRQFLLLVVFSAILACPSAPPTPPLPREPVLEEVNEQLKNLAKDGKPIPQELEDDVTTLRTQTENGEAKYILVVTHDDEINTQGDVNLVKGTKQLKKAADVKAFAVLKNLCADPCDLTTLTTFHVYTIVH